MLNWLFGSRSKTIQSYREKNAKMIDVRTAREFGQGHAQGSINVPLDQLAGKMKSLKKDEYYLLCCASGLRSSRATEQMKGHGFVHVYNAGAWTNLKSRKS
jgi:rhodanese-related sulfurtransferase